VQANLHLTFTTVTPPFHIHPTILTPTVPFHLHFASVIAGHSCADLCLITSPLMFSYSDFIARMRKTAVFETVALGGYGGSTARTMDIREEEMRIHLQAPNLIGTGRNGPSGDDQNRFLPLQLDYEQQQLGNQPDDELYVRNNGIHWVDETVGTTISQSRSRLSKRQKLAQNC